MITCGWAPVKVAPGLDRVTGMDLDSLGVVLALVATVMFLTVPDGVPAGKVERAVVGDEVGAGDRATAAFGVVDGDAGGQRGAVRRADRYPDQRRLACVHQENRLVAADLGLGVAVQREVVELQVTVGIARQVDGEPPHRGQVQHAVGRGTGGLVVGALDEAGERLADLVPAGFAVGEEALPQLGVLAVGAAVLDLVLDLLAGAGSLVPEGETGCPDQFWGVARSSEKPP